MNPPPSIRVPITKQHCPGLCTWLDHYSLMAVNRQIELLWAKHSGSELSLIGAWMLDILVLLGVSCSLFLAAPSRAMVNVRLERGADRVFART